MATSLSEREKVLLARMMVPEPMRPGWDQALAMSASRIPCKRLATIDQRIEMMCRRPVCLSCDS